jgi:hypothetical protein
VETSVVMLSVVSIRATPWRLAARGA